MAENDLDELFPDDDVAEAEVVEEQETGEETEAEVPETVAEVEEEVPPTDDKPFTKEEFKGYLDEREKRQKLERELEQLKQSQTAKPEQEIDPIEDPQGFKAAMEQQMRQSLFEQDRKWMKRLHSDWDAAEAWINEQIGENLAVQAKLQGSESILDDAYKLYQDHIALQGVEGVSEIRSENEALKARIAELEGGVSEQAKSKATSKPSLTGTTNSGGGVESEGDLTLEDLMGSDFNTRPK